eukprot:TRINITY_DN12543_c0_g1_i2.p1 TRINITY_DN12543_c0_g1~~TRINITY_DN12543_c0_g1_i2.p1  ORF type:complete len:404 (-),score=92.73 TRINITY_DN12543_c0_g1_i2:129-1340(-)
MNILDCTCIKTKGNIPKELSFIENNPAQGITVKKQRRLSKKLLPLFKTSESESEIEFGEPNKEVEEVSGEMKGDEKKKQAFKRISSGMKTLISSETSSQSQNEAEPLEGGGKKRRSLKRSLASAKRDGSTKGKSVESSEDTDWGSHTESKSEYIYEEESLSTNESTPRPSFNKKSLSLDQFSLHSVIDNMDKCDKLYKVIIIGDSAVGKTNLLKRWSELNYSEKYIPPPTIHLEFTTKTWLIDGQVIRVQFWDTAGQERYRAMTKQYYRANGAVLVYSIADASSFKSIAKWLSELESVNSIPTLLVGNKSDLTKDRKVTGKEGEEYSKSRDMLFCETSAKNGSNCAKAMQDILKYVHNTESKIERESIHEKGDNPDLIPNVEPGKGIILVGDENMTAIRFTEF